MGVGAGEWGLGLRAWVSVEWQRGRKHSRADSFSLSQACLVDALRPGPRPSTGTQHRTGEKLQIPGHWPQGSLEVAEPHPTACGPNQW